MPYNISIKLHPIPSTFRFSRFFVATAAILKFLSLKIMRTHVRQNFWKASSNGVHLSHSRQMAHVYYQLFDSKMADGDQRWSVPKLEYDLLRRNASTNDRKTDLIERCILHRNPKHTIYVRYFSILLYLLNVQVAPTENH